MYASFVEEALGEIRGALRSGFSVPGVDNAALLTWTETHPLRARMAMYQAAAPGKVYAPPSEAFIEQLRALGPQGADGWAGAAKIAGDMLASLHKQYNVKSAEYVAKDTYMTRKKAVDWLAAAEAAGTSGFDTRTFGGAVRADVQRILAGLRARGWPEDVTMAASAPPLDSPTVDLEKWNTRAAALLADNTGRTTRDVRRPPIVDAHTSMTPGTWPTKDLGSMAAFAGVLVRVFTDEGGTITEPNAVWLTGPLASGAKAPVVIVEAHIAGVTQREREALVGRARRTVAGGNRPIDLRIASSALGAGRPATERYVDLTRSVRDAIAATGVDAGPDVDADARSVGAGVEALPEVRGAMTALAQRRGVTRWAVSDVEDVDLWTEGKRRDGNVAALRLASQIEAENRAPTADEREVLARYSGWGGVEWSRVPADVRPERAAGLLYEYYTPTGFCSAVWQLMLRCHSNELIVDDPRVLEPSAGIGRFLATAPSNMRWTAVELAPESFTLLRLLYPQAETYQGAFEHFVRDNGDRRAFDLIVSNPPYVGRGALKTVDPKGRKWGEEADYFMAASARMLAPGGIMVHLVPLGFLTGKDAKLREELLKSCHFMGAFIPPADMFPGARVNVCLSVFQRRASTLKEVRAEDREILAGRYLEGEGRDNINGQWREKQRQSAAVRAGKGKPGLEVVGTFDPQRLVQMDLRPMPAEERAALAALPPEAGADRVIAPVRAKKGAATDDATANAETAARGLGSRVLRLGETVRTDAVLAETGRAELLADVKAWIAANGNPHKHAIRSASDREALAFLGSVSAAGVFSPLLATTAAAVDVAGFRGDAGDIVQVIGFQGGRSGETTLTRVRALYRGPVEALATHPKRDTVAIVWGTDPALMTREWFLSGNLYDRLASMTSAGNVPAWAAERHAVQRKWLMDAIDPLPPSEIDIDLRSGFLPPRVIAEYLESLQRGQPVSLAWDEGYLESTGVATSNGREILGYINRETKIEEKDASGRVSKSMRQSGEVDARIAADEAMNGRFTTWVRDHARWGPEIADLYNRTYRAERARPFSSEPLALARANPAMKLRPHQSNAVRVASETRGGLIAHDVGLGKTLLALAMVAKWRQEGIARRPLIVVPKQVLTNWLKEARRLLPDYAIGTIGVTETTEPLPGELIGEMSEDNKAAKRRKWHLYAQGAYELTLVTIPAFLDVSVTPANKVRLYEANEWIKREEKLAKREDSYQDKVLEQTKADYETFKGELAELQEAWDSRTKLDDPRISYWERERVKTANEKAKKKLDAMKKKVEKLLATIEKKEAGAKGGQRKIEQARQEFEEWVAKRGFASQGDYVYWEDLNCDALVVDEAHFYKNLLSPESRYGSVPKYLGSSDDKECRRCWDLWLKCHIVRENNDGTGITLLTATPLKNSPVEIYTLLQYVRPDVWAARGIKSHEEFIDRYMVVASDEIVTPMGTVETAPIVSGYKNMQEMRQILNLVMDYRIAEDVGLRVPEAKSHFETVPMSPEAVSVYAALREEAAEALAGRGVTEEGRHYFAIVAEMEKAALDVGLLGVVAAARPPKYIRLARNIRQSCQSREGACDLTCAHVVFIDSVEGQDTLIATLVEQGIPRKRIAVLKGSVDLEDRQAIVDGLNGEWAWDVAEKRWYAKVAPLYDVVIGHSAVMAEGVNLQTRACAIHHLTFPYEPATIQQRNGRGVRQGNLSERLRRNLPPDDESGYGVVGLYYYMSERSYDAFKLQLISGKRSWMATLLRGADNAVNNPAASVKLGRDEMLIMLSADPDAARLKLETIAAGNKAQKDVKRKQQAAADFARYVGLWRSARRTDDPELSTRYREDARRIRAVLQVLPSDIFNGAAYLDRAETINILWDHASGYAFIEGEALCVSGQGQTRHFDVLMVDPNEKAITARPWGQWLPGKSPVSDFGSYKLEAVCEWPQDEATALGHDADRFDLTQIHKVPEKLLDAHGDVLWKNMRQGWKWTPPEGDAYPVNMGNGRVELVRWGQRADTPWKDIAPLWPTDANFQTFLRGYHGTKKNRTLVARGWFGRAVPKELDEGDDGGTP